MKEAQASHKVAQGRQETEADKQGQLSQSEGQPKQSHQKLTVNRAEDASRTHPLTKDWVG